MKSSVRTLKRSRWRSRIATIAVVNVFWSIAGVRTSSATFPFGLSTYGLLVGGSMLVLTPVFYHAIHRDAGRLRETDSRWVPDRRVWVGGGVLFSLLSIVLYLNPLTHYVAAVYLIQRFRKTPPLDPTEGTN